MFKVWSCYWSGSSFDTAINLGDLKIKVRGSNKQVSHHTHLEWCWQNTRLVLKDIDTAQWHGSTSATWASSIGLKQQILTPHRGQQLVVRSERDPGKGSCLRLAFLLLFFPLHVLQPFHTSCSKELVVSCRCYLGLYCAGSARTDSKRGIRLHRDSHLQIQDEQSDKGRWCTKRSGLKKRAEGTPGVKVLSNWNQQDFNCIQLPALS